MGLINKMMEYVFGKQLAAETIRYIIVGGMTTLVNFGMFELLYHVLGIQVTVSNVTAIAVSILFAYFANKFVVFRRRSDSFRDLMGEFGKFIGSRLFTMALEVGVVELFYNVIGIDARLGKIAAQILVIIANYLISKLIVFKKTPPPDDEKS